MLYPFAAKSGPRSTDPLSVAEPLFVINCGMSHREIVPPDNVERVAAHFRAFMSR